MYQLADPALDEKPNAHAMMVFGGANLILDIVCIQSLVQGANLKQITAWLFGHKSEVERGPTPTIDGSEWLQVALHSSRGTPQGTTSHGGGGRAGRLAGYHARPGARTQALPTSLSPNTVALCFSLTGAGAALGFPGD